MTNIRNFCIIAHIDHGKSTLADRFLELTATIEKRKMKEQILDQMELERERGITIKLQPVRMEYSISRTNADLTLTDADSDGLLYEGLTYKIRGAAFKVRKEVGLGHKEIIYQKALEEEFKKMNLNYEREKTIDVKYEDKKIGIYRPDFVIDNKIIIEIKSLPFIGNKEEKQMWTYLKGSEYKLLLLINFSSDDVYFKRIVYDIARPRMSASSPRKSAGPESYILNLIDTPGHVDFSYEVSRSLAAVEGAILLVDATQGVQAQTLSNFYLAREQGLKIIPVINKIDLKNARVEEVEQEILELLKCDKKEILKVSAKTGEGVEKVLEAVVEKVPAPVGSKQSMAVWNDRGLSEKNNPHIDHVGTGLDMSLQALVFDSVYDDYRGVVAYVRLMNGEVKRGDKIYLIGTKKQSEVMDVGYFKPELKSAEKLCAGEIGYIVTGFKDLSSCQVGDTVTSVRVSKYQSVKDAALAGYKKMKPMVFAGLFCKQGTDFKDLREGLEKIGLTDASISFEPESSPALGPGFRCGFLGLLHLEVIEERLRREYGLNLIVTVPSVAYKITKLRNYESTKLRNYESTKVQQVIHSPQELPAENEIGQIEEPWVKIDVITPNNYLGGVMKLLSQKRALHVNTEYLTQGRAVLHYEMPLSSLLTDFYDKLKSTSSGYASMAYELIDYRDCDVIRLDILVAEELVEALSVIVYKDEAYRLARKIVDTLKDVLPRQMFEVKIQAVLGYQDKGKTAGGKIIASSKISPYRKDVTAKLYGGDVTRKMKLLEKQKKGKKKMRSSGKGKVDIPSEAFVAVLKR